MSRRTTSGLRAVSAMAPSDEGSARQLCLRDRLLGNRWHAATESRHADREEQAREERESPGDDEEREPGGHRRRESGRDRREQEAERKEREDAAGRDQHHAGAERGDLLAHLERRQLALEPNERSRVLRDLVHARLHAPVGALSADGHGYASR